MTQRLIVLLVSGLTALAVVSGIHAQDSSPTPAICGYPMPERALAFAFAEQRSAIALVTSLGDYGAATGRPARIERVLEGDLAVGETTVDSRPGITCVQRDVYGRGETLLVTFVVAPEEDLVSTTFGLPVAAARDGVNVADPDTPLADIEVLTADGPRRLDELLEAGRTYVEPTPTLAPGQTARPTFEVPDTGVTAPNTGSGASSSRHSLGIVIGVTALSLGAAGAGILIRRRA